MARSRKSVHGGVINQKTAEEKYQKSRFWFYHRRSLLTPIDPDSLGLSKRCRWYYEDEIVRLIHNQRSALRAS